MLESRVIYHHGKRYTLCETTTRVMEPGARGVLSRFQAEQLLTELMRGPSSADLRAVYAAYSGSPVILHIPNGTVLRWLVRQLYDPLGGGRLVFIEEAGLMQRRAAAAPQDEPEARRIDALLAGLGRSDLIHRGHTYRVVRGANASALPNRDGYEVVSGREAHALLEEMVADATRPELQKPVLSELALQFGKPRVGPALEIVLLRGMRIYARPAHEEPASTPSQLFKEKHFIALEAVDAEEKPVAGVALEFVLPDGSTKNASTNEEGYARVDLARAGSVIIRVPGIDGSSWRAVGGAAASPSGKEAPVRSHVVEQGECLSKIAMKYGFPKWEPVWQHGENAELRQKRKSPHVLFPGDTLAVPGMAVNQITRDADATHRIEVQRAESTVDVSVTFRDSKGNALGNQAFELRWGGDPEPKISGTLDGSGTLKESVPISVRDVELLLVERAERYVLATSHLDPVEDEAGAFLISGVASRLSALGYLHRMPKEISALTIRDAILAFQRDELGQSEPSGELDGATCQKLEELYGV